jgi:NTP pyrophosphatase (non-canonical NTP hydrolase)
MRITQFFDAMLEKLDKNRHKGGWHNCTNAYLKKRLYRELSELLEAVKNGSGEEIRKEAADVANFAFFIADVNENNKTKPEEHRR